VECLSEDEYAWCATSDDPSFTVELVGSLLKKPGWYTLRIHLKTSLSKIRAKFYFDTGKGANEKESLILSGNDDAVIKRIFYAEKPVKKLRFDPMEKAEKFTIKHISLCKRDEARAKKYMLDILLQSDKYKSVKEKSILENMLSKLGKDKYSSIMSTIYSEYNRLYPSMSDFDANYLKWIASNDTITIHDRSLIKHHISSFNSRPKFSILMPVYNTRPQFLREAIDSVSSQIYQDWELCIVDDNSTIEDVSEILLGFSAQDSRIKTSFRKENGGISACTNTALDMATGDWIVLMDHDDILPEYALYMVAEAINTHPDVSILYSDEDRMDENGKRFKPYFKPSFNYDLFLGQNMINHLGVYRADLVQRAGGFREGFEGSQDWDLALRVMDVASNPRIHHIPFILYHWRSGGERFSTQSTIRTREASERAVNEHFRRTGQAAEAIPLQISSFLRIKRELPSVRPLVSIIIPTQNFDDRFKTCIDGLLNRTSYSPMEIIVADNGSNEQNVPLYDELRSHQFVNIIKAPEPFNFSKLVNKAASASSGEILVLLHKDTKITNSEWLNEMVCHVLRSDVGAVGAKLCDESDTIQHAGVVFKNHNDGDSIDEHIHRGVPRSFSGYFHRLIFTHEVACVTKVCLATRREVFMELGGFDENNLSVFFNDIHFCFQARQAGYRIIWTPHAELYHYNDQANQVSFSNSEQYSSIYKAEHAYMRKIWGKELDEDPFYNPNLSLHNAEFNISHKPRTKKPWLEFAASLWNLDQSHNLTSDITEAMLEASQQRMNDSVADRLGRVDKYKKDIEAYASARCGRSEAHNTEKIAIYAAISGDYDSIKMPAHLDDRFDYILFTDTPAPSTGVWQIRPFPDFDLDLTRRARYIKTHPHRLLNGYDIAIWIDANIMILGDIYPLIQDFILSDKSVAAVFHPLRNSLYDEFNACIKYKIDDVSRMENQLNRYKNIGFMSDELIESNVMMFKLTDTKVDLFLDTWWSEIESYSKRDQLSLNFALAHHGLKWHQLAKPPNSIRNHPLFAMVCHDKKQSPAQQLVDVLTTATEESKIFAGDQHLIAPENVAQPTGIDIIVPVYNALGDVQLCLSSLEKFTDGFDVSIIVVNDGSDEATTQWLRDWCKDKQLYNLIEQPSNQGYTKSVNLGLKISTAPYVITQNSDTIVTAGWLKKMVACIESDPDLGVVGPLSNAASWQNVPVLKDESGNFAVNQLPLGLDVDSMAIIVAEVSERRYPRIRFVNGFCFLMRRSVLTTIGYMDEVNFPKGYGEENDFCMRLSDAGFKMAIADDVFIYHAKSKSFGHDFRVALSKQGGDALIKKHGKDKVHGAVDQTKKAAKLLDPLRMKLDQLLYQTNEVASTKETTDTKHNIKPIIKPPPVFGTREYQKDAPFSGPILTLPLEKVDKSNNTDWPFSIGIHLHLYYLDLLEEFSDYLSNIPAKFTLYVSVVDAACVQNVQAHFEKALKSCTLVVKVFENKGRDIAAFIAGFGKELSQHDIICHIHSKRSLHNQAKRDWRRQLLHNLMGSRTYVDELFSLFVKNKHIGMVFPEFHWSLKEQISWGTNFSVCQKVANRIGIDINEFILPLFPAGSMFWARSKALRQLLQAGINYADFPNEDKQIDGTFAHAVERLFGAIVQENNFDLMQVRAEKPHKMKSNTTDSNVGGRKELSHEKA
jgi:GT2 family glycosyltransferase